MEFTFVGYLIQEPYLRQWWMREGYRTASIERRTHPDFDKIQWNVIGDLYNATEFLTEIPDLNQISNDVSSFTHEAEPESESWTLNGYAIENQAIEKIIMERKDGKDPLRIMAYARHLIRPEDDLRLLGYEVVDAIGWPLSLLNNCGYKAEEIASSAGPLNTYSLFDTAEQASKFCQYVKDDPATPPHDDGVILQVWGYP